MQLCFFLYKNYEPTRLLMNAPSLTFLLNHLNFSKYRIRCCIFILQYLGNRQIIDLNGDFTNYRSFFLLFNYEIKIK